MLAIIQLLPPLLAQEGGETHAMSWALVVFVIAIGLAIAVMPAKRTSEIKRRKDED